MELVQERPAKSAPLNLSTTILLGWAMADRSTHNAADSTHTLQKL